MNKGSLIAVSVLLVGCASAVGWGKKYEVMHQNSKSITIKYDSVVADMKDFAPTAEAHCKQFGKEAVPQRGQNGSAQGETIYGGIHTITFLCE